MEQWYFNELTTVERKTKDAIAAHLGGVMVWELGQDCLSYHDGPCRHAAPPLMVRELGQNSHSRQLHQLTHYPLCPPLPCAAHTTATHLRGTQRTRGRCSPPSRAP